MKDTGIGIAPEDLPKLFTRFGKLQRTSEMNSEGLGLGLEIVKKLCEIYGGEVCVFSQGIEQGSTFSFTMRLEPVVSDLDED